MGLLPREGSAESRVKAFLVSAALHQIERVRHFVETEGLHPDASYRGKPTALCYAVLKPYPSLMRYLYEKGADVNYRDCMGMSPLHYAALGGSEYCLSFLIGTGAALNETARNGATPLGLILNRQDRADCRELLRRHGACPLAAAPRPPSFH